MKKIVSAFLCYAIFAAVVVFCVGFFTFEVASVPQSTEMPYKFSNGLVALFDSIPSICFTAFLLGCSIAFGDSAKKAEHRFSPELGKILKKLLGMAIVTTFVISLCTLVFLPFEKSKIQTMKDIPVVLNEYTSLTLKYLANDEPEIALKYADRALALDSKNERLAELKRKAEIARRVQEIDEQREKSISYAETNLNEAKKLPDLFDESQMTVKDMLAKSRENLEANDFFAAHYFAVNATRLCQADDLGEAKYLAEKAWEELQKVQMEDDTEGMIFFRKKLAGYNALINGNFVEAYYVFYGLSQEDARKERDPDVMRYLALSQKHVLDTYFFIDETENLSTFESVNNMYFSLPHVQGGGYDIVLIRGVTEIEGSGGLVRYLHGLQIYSFDENKNLLYTIKTPYAKMVAVKVSDLTEGDRRLYASDKSIKMIPEIKLCSLSRSSDKEKNIPEYEFMQNDSPRESDKPNKFYWPIPYQEFSMIAQSFAGQLNLNPFSIRKLSDKAPDYGFSREGFSFAMLNKIFYPFMTLVFLIFIAIIAWNYRLAAHAIFKFKWVFILPLFNLIFYFVRSAVEYIVRIMNFVFIAMAGVDLALLAGIVFYALLLGATILTFLARKGD